MRTAMMQLWSPNKNQKGQKNANIDQIKQANVKVNSSDGR